MIEIYNGSYDIVAKSGVGQAIVHQQKILDRMNIETTGNYQDGASIVHINTVFPDSVIEAMRARRRGQKVVWYAHSTEEDFRNSFPGSNLVSPAFKQWIKFCYSLGDIVITPTAYSKDLVESYHIDRPIYVMSNGVDTSLFHADESVKPAFREELGLDADAKIVISVGHFIERKGLPDFLEVARTMPDVHFLWYGHTPDALITKSIREAVAQAPENVRFMGFTPQEELVRAYQAADAFLFLSQEETEGIVVLEALACELPVIVRDIPVYSNWLTNESSALKVTSIDEAISSVNAVLYGENTTALGGKHVACTRDYEQLGRQLLHIYEMEGWAV